LTEGSDTDDSSTQPVVKRWIDGITHPQFCLRLGRIADVRGWRVTMSATGSKTDLARDNPSASIYRSIVRPELGAIFSLLDNLRSLFWANNFPDPMLREFGW
jgi:hypothetical protein